MIERFPERLKAAMRAANMRQIDLAEKAGVPKGAINYYIKGKTQPKADRLYLIAKALDVNEAWLIGYDAPMERDDEQKKNDHLVEVVEKLKMDAEFFGAVVQLSELSDVDYATVKALLQSLSNK